MGLTAHLPFVQEKAELSRRPKAPAAHGWNPPSLSGSGRPERPHKPHGPVHLSPLPAQGLPAGSFLPRGIHPGGAPRDTCPPTPVRLWYAPAGLASCPAGSALSSAHSEARVLRSDLRGDPAPGPGTLLPHEEAAPQGLWGLTREEGGSPGVPLGVCPWGTWRAPVSAPGQALYSGGARRSF